MRRFGVRPVSTAAAQVYAARRRQRDQRRNPTRRNLFAPAPKPRPPKEDPMDISGAEAAASIRARADALEAEDPKLAGLLRRLAEKAETGNPRTVPLGRVRAVAGGGLDNSLPRGDRDDEGEQLELGTGR